MNISSVIVHARPDLSARVIDSIHAIAGAEVHASSPDGRLIVTMEADDAGASTRMYESIERTDGVLSVSLVYQHTETDPEKEI